MIRNFINIFLAAPGWLLVSCFPLFPDLQRARLAGKRQVMKTFCILLLLFSTICSGSVQAQLKRNVYWIQIEGRQGDRLKGWVMALQDSAIQVFIPGKVPVDTVVQVKYIQRILLRRKNAMERGFGKGVLIGGVAGALIGYATYSPGCDSPGWCFDLGPGVSMLGGGFIGGLAGGVLGIIGGTTYSKYMIYGDQPSYDAFKTKILNGPKSTLKKQIKLKNKKEALQEG